MALQVWLPLNGNLENKGLSKITITNNDATIDDNGKIGKCYLFDGVNNYIKILYDNFSNNFSISLWFYRINGTWIFNTRNSTYGGVGAYVDGNNKLVIDCMGAAKTSSRWTTSTIITNNIWYNLIIVRNQQKIQYYINGIFIQEKQIEYSNTFGNAITLCCRNTNGSSIADYSSYKLNDFRIYDHCLSAKEVYEISQALILHWKLDCDNKLDNQIKRNFNLLTPSILNNSSPWMNSISGTEIYKDKSAILINSNGLYNNTSKGTTSVFPNLTFKQNTQYTISIIWCEHLRTDGNSSSLIFKFKYDDGTSSSNITSPTADANSNWVHSKLTSAAGKNVSMVCSTYGRTGKISIAYIKIEEGNIDTDVALSKETVYNSDGYILPINAKRIEYLQSDGTAYINTGIPYDSTKSTYRIECKFNQPATVGSYDAIFGAYTAEANKCLRIIRLNNNSIMGLYYNNQANGSNRVTLTTSNTTIREVVMTSSSFTCTESETTTNYTAPTVNGTNTTSTFYLFCQGIVNNTISCASKSRIYYFRLYDNNNIIKEFIPVNYNGEYGMWETVNKEFYPNSNSSGTFTAGPKINVIYDCSGYGHNGYSICDKEFISNTPRYNYCLNNTSEYPCKTITSIDFPESSGLTISCWINLTIWGNQTSGLWATSNLSTDPTDYDTTACNHRDAGFDIRGTNGTTYRLTCNSTDIPKNTWKHVVITHDGANAKLYINGVLIRTKEIPSTLAAFKYVYLGYSRAESVIRKCQGSWSDFRIYATALSESAILKLYNNSAHIDNKHNIYGFEFDEWNITNPKILKRGIIEINEFEENHELENIKFIKNSIIPNQIIEK